MPPAAPPHPPRPRPPVGVERTSGGGAHTQRVGAPPPRLLSPTTDTPPNPLPSSSFTSAIAPPQVCGTAPRLVPARAPTGRGPQTQHQCTCGAAARPTVRASASVPWALIYYRVLRFICCVFYQSKLSLPFDHRVCFSDLARDPSESEAPRGRLPSFFLCVVQYGVRVLYAARLLRLASLRVERHPDHGG